MSNERSEIGAAVLRRRLVRGSAASLAIKLIAILLQFALAILLARGLGAEGYGAYVFVLAIVMLLSIPAQFGLPNLVVRETARAAQRGDWASMKGVWRWATLVVAISSLTISLIVLLVGRAWLDPEKFALLLPALLLVPLIPLGNLRGASLRGLGHVVAGLLPDSILRPALFVLALVGLYSLAPMRLTAQSAMLMHVIAAALAFMTGALILMRCKPPPLFFTKRRFEIRSWLSATLPLALLSAMQLINQQTDILILGLFRPLEDVGIYRITIQGAALVILGLQAVNIAVAPHFARLHAAGDHNGLAHAMRTASGISFLIALPIAVLFFVAGDEILWVIFGDEFKRGGPALMILVLGQLLNASMGTVGSLLNMTGHERETARGVGLSAVANIILNFLLVPPYGMVGAATATALTLLLWNLLLWRSIHMRLGISILPGKRVIRQK